MTAKSEFKVWFVQEADYLQQIALLDTVKDSTSEIVLWAYPELKADVISDWALHDSSTVEAEPATDYQEDTATKCTDRLPMTSTLFPKLRENSDDVQAQCDSLCLYRSGLNEWGVSVICHEGIVLVRDESLLPKLQTAGFFASAQAPDWW